MIVGALGSPQRVEVGEVHDVHRHAGADDECNCECLAGHAPDVAQQLPVESADHHDSSRGVILRPPRLSTLATRPSASRITRSAIPAIAALWVITMVVVPSC